MYITKWFGFLVVVVVCVHVKGRDVDSSMNKTKYSAWGCNH